MGSAFFGHVGVVFHEERIKRRCSIVTDLDVSLIELPDNPEADNEDQRHARAAQNSGEYRRNTLNGFTDGNTFVRVFFAEHTFEPDFLFAQNTREVRETVDEIYSSDRHREQIKTDLSSLNKEIAGKAVLRLANKLGKGWFSLLLSEKCRADTVIPEYILRALAFAIDEVSADSIKRMGIFRLTNEFYNNDTRQLFPDINMLKQLSAQDFIKLYKETAPDDVLSLFIDYLEEYRER